MTHPLAVAKVEAEAVTALERAQLVRCADENAERAVLASLFHDAIEDVLPLLVPSSFYWPGHQAVFRIATQLHEAKQPIDEQTIGSALDRAGLLDKFDMSFLHSLRTATPDVTHARAHAQIVADLHTQRRVVETAMLVVTEGLAGKDNPQAFVNRAASRMTKAIERTKETRLVSMRQAVRARSVTWKHQREVGYEGGLLTGLVALDEKTDGLARPGFSVFAAETGAGKTVIGWTIAQNVASCADIDGRRQAVVYVSGEVNEEKLHDRAVCSRAGITLRVLARVMAGAPDYPRESVLSPMDRDEIRRKVNEAQLWLEAAPLYVYPRVAGLDDIRSALREAKREIAEETPKGQQPARVTLLVVDYLQMMKLPEADRHDLRLSLFAEGLATIANEELIAVVALVQANSGAKKREGGAFSNLDLKSASSMADPASLVAFLERKILAMGKADAEKKRAWANYSEIHITKGRAHSQGRMPFFFDGSRSIIRDAGPSEFSHLTELEDD